MEQSDDLARVPEIDCATRRVTALAVHFNKAEASVGGKRPRGSREREPVYVYCEPKDNDEVAHQQLPRNFAISYDCTKQSRPADCTKQSRPGCTKQSRQ